MTLKNNTLILLPVKVFFYLIYIFNPNVSLFIFLSSNELLQLLIKDL